MITNYNQLLVQKIGRIEALSDGVFAIALTLLVLEIKVPSSEHIQSEVELWYSLKPLLPKFLSYFLSFMTMGIFYTGHTLQLSYMKYYDRHLTWNTLFFLMLVSLLPFTTAFLGEHITFRLSIVLYWLNMLLLSVFLYAHWQYASRHNFISLTGEQRVGVDRAIRRRMIQAEGLYLLAVSLCILSTYLSITFIIAVQLNYAFGLITLKSTPSLTDATR